MSEQCRHTRLARRGEVWACQTCALEVPVPGAAALSQAGEPGREAALVQRAERVEQEYADLIGAIEELATERGLSDEEIADAGDDATPREWVERMLLNERESGSASSGATREGATDSILNRRVMGYRARVEFVASRRVLFGTLDGIRDVVTFESATVEGMEDAMRASILDYLSQCREAGEPPNPPPPHEHCCMRCGGTFECPMGEECEAGRDVMPNLIRRDAHGNVVVVEHCPMPATHPGASHV